MGWLCKIGLHRMSYIGERYAVRYGTDETICLYVYECRCNHRQMSFDKRGTGYWSGIGLR